MNKLTQYNLNETLKCILIVIFDLTMFAIKIGIIIFLIRYVIILIKTI